MAKRPNLVACTAGNKLGSTGRRGRPRKSPAGPPPAPAADSPLQPTSAGEGQPHGSANGGTISSGSGGYGDAQGAGESSQQRRADEMLRGELLSSLLKRREMQAQGGSTPSGSPFGGLQQRGQPQPEPEWSLPPFVPPRPEASAATAAAYLQEEQQQDAAAPAPLPAAGAAAAEAAEAAAAAAAAAAPRRRGRPRKHPLPEAAPGSSLVASADGAAAGLAGNYGAAVALAAYQDALARQPLVLVCFQLKARLEYGTRVRVVGGHDALGECLACPARPSGRFAARLCCVRVAASAAWLLLVLHACSGATGPS